MVPGDRVGSLLLKGCAPVLGAPAAGVGRIHPDDRDPAPRGHAAQPGAEPSGGDASNGAAQPFPALATAEGFPAGGARVGEVQVLHHDRRAALPVGQLKQRADGRAHPPIAPRCSQPSGFDRDGDGFTDRVARRVEHTRGQMVGIEVHTQHWPGAQFVELRHRLGRGFPGRVQIPPPAVGVVGDVVAHRLSRAHPRPPVGAAVAELHRRGDHQVRTELVDEGGGHLDTQSARLIDADGFVPAGLA